MVRRFETCGKRVKKNKVSSTVNCLFFLLFQRALCRVSSSSFLRTESVFSLIGADSLSRSVHCAPDENDRPSEQTKNF